MQPARISPGTVSPTTSFAGGPARQMSDIAWEAAGVTYTENGVTKTIPNLLMVTGDGEGDRTASSRYEWVPTNRRMRVISAGTRQVLSDVPMKQGNNRIGVKISGGLVLPAQ